MRRSRFSDEQIIGILKEHQAGMSTADLCREYGVSDATIYKWCSMDGDLEVSKARRLKELMSERRRFGSRRLHILLKSEDVAANWKTL